MSRRDVADIRLVITDNPPVNALGQAVREELARQLSEAEIDPVVRVVILICAGSGFFVGADICELGRPRLPPRIFELAHQIDAMRTPVVAAIHGNALGGGLEIALASHRRIATRDARFGLPEVKLGLIPGAGGTQRLPRLIGIEKAVDVIVSGRSLSASEALEVGLVDEVVKDNLEESALRLARRLLASPGSPIARTYGSEPLLVPSPDYFSKLRQAEARRTRGQKSPSRCIDAVELTTRLTLSEGLRREREIFVELEADEQSAALRHVFFAEREAAVVPDIGTEAGRPVARAAVLGSGTMGTGITMCLANAGISVRLTDASDAALQRAKATIETTYDDAVARGRISPDERAARLRLVELTAGVAETVAGADIVIEAVIEDLALKLRLFAELDREVPRGTILASNTSTLDVNAMACATARPERVLGLHFFSPAHVMRLVEIVRADKTSPQVLASTLRLARRLGKVPVVVGVCDGFVGNRMLAQRTREAERLLASGALPHEIDRAMTDFGFPMGPFAAADLAGLDVGWRVRQARGTPLEIADRLYEMGRLGQKVGRGYYRYEAGERTPLRDQEAEALIVEVARRHGFAQRTFTPGEIIERLLYPLINEGARILEEGVALRSGDIDVVWIHGYGWPAWRGGPMYYAGTIGLGVIRDRLRELHQEFRHPSLQPAGLLSLLADRGQSFEAGTSVR
ncbi:MAG: 3-hydroxyacyl-CoA dehydrogenase NAD-binding domain-containing protein [Dongiaceae bacterium]